jgi:MtN3 and saliva related transmembrane protein
MIDFIGYTSGFLLAFCLVPQVIKSWKSKSTHDISFLWNSIFVFALLLYLVYAILISATPLIVAGIVEAVLAISLLVAKVKYG